MKLDLYLYIKKNNTTMTDFSKLIGCRRETLSKIINGHIKPSALTALAIEKATNGEITRDYLLRMP